MVLIQSIDLNHYVLSVDSGLFLETKELDQLLLF